MLPGVSETILMSEMAVVIDASRALKALLPNPETERCRAVLNRLQAYLLVAPALWTYEATSSLVKAVHFNQLTVADIQAVLRQALALEVQIVALDEAQSMLALEGTLRLDQAATYDSFYLALAETFLTIGQPTNA